MRIAHGIEINAPIERVFECVSDDEKAKKWIDGLVSVKYLTRRTKKNPVGAKFRRRFEIRGRTIEREGEITEYEEPKLLGLRFAGGGPSVDEHYRFEPVKNGTKFNYEADYVFPGLLLKLTSFLYARSVKRDVARQLENLKALAEQLESVDKQLESMRKGSQQNREHLVHEKEPGRYGTRREFQTLTEEQLANRLPQRGERAKRRKLRRKTK